MEIRRGCGSNIHVVRRGNVLSQTKSGKGMIIFDLYDGTATITCKSFAKDLKEGVPCPVCGACEHPKIAILKEEAPTQAVIEEEKKKSDEAKERREQCNHIVAAQREKAKALKNQRLEQWERCMQETDEKEDAAENENNLNKKQEKPTTIY